MTYDYSAASCDYKLNNSIIKHSRVPNARDLNGV